jgi:hypothetical protein
MAFSILFARTTFGRSVFPQLWTILAEGTSHEADRLCQKKKKTIASDFFPEPP